MNDNNEYITKLIENLTKEKKKLREKINNIDKIIDGLQNYCDHIFVKHGHDSHRDIEKCTICGYVEYL